MLIKKRDGKPYMFDEMAYLKWDESFKYNIIHIQCVVSNELSWDDVGAYAPTIILTKLVHDSTQITTCLI